MAHRRSPPRRPTQRSVSRRSRTTATRRRRGTAAACSGVAVVSLGQAVRLATSLASGAGISRVDACWFPDPGTVNAPRVRRLRAGGARVAGVNPVAAGDAFERLAPPGAGAARRRSISAREGAVGPAARRAARAASRRPPPRVCRLGRAQEPRRGSPRPAGRARRSAPRLIRVRHAGDRRRRRPVVSSPPAARPELLPQRLAGARPGFTSWTSSPVSSRDPGSCSAGAHGST